MSRQINQQYTVRYNKGIFNVYMYLADLEFDLEIIRIRKKTYHKLIIKSNYVLFIIFYLA